MEIAHLAVRAKTRSTTQRLTPAKSSAGFYSRPSFQATPVPVRKEALKLPINQRLLQRGNFLCRIEAFRAGLRAVQDGVAPVKPERILEIVEARARRFITAVLDPAICLQQRGRSEITIRIPPVARARRRAAGAQDAFIHAVELGAVLV